MTVTSTVISEVVSTAEPTLREQLQAHASTYDDITTDNIFEVLAELINIAERFMGASGAAKRGAVLEALTIAVNALPDSDGKREVLAMLQSGMIEKTINLAIAIARSPVFNRFCLWLRIKCRNIFCCSCCKK